ncbi:MAG: SEC-C metal-binding domain-containing protein, partial [Defluviitaleaceae bacterium]|nr:SEC-C metal-binding domain-containing protein [Defluviitaleaceae bacterium]
AAGQSEFPEEWDIMALNEGLQPIFRKFAVILTDEDKQSLTREELVERIYAEAVEIYDRREQEFTTERMREIERKILLHTIDQKWMDHIDDMDQMRQGISLRAYAQRDPLVEYKFLGHDMFEELSKNIQLDTVRAMYNVQIMTDTARERVAKEAFTNMDTSLANAPVRRKDAKVGRNDPCPCGSGKKFKQCCSS